MDLPSAAPGCDLHFGRRLRQEHRGFQVGLVDPVERLFRDFDERLLDLHADAIDQCVEAAEPVDHAVDRAGEWSKHR